MSPLQSGAFMHRIYRLVLKCLMHLTAEKGKICSGSDEMLVSKPVPSGSHRAVVLGVAFLALLSGGYDGNIITLLVPWLLQPLCLQHGAAHLSGRPGFGE